MGKFSADDILKYLSCFFFCFFMFIFKKIRFEISCRFALNVKLCFLRKISNISICCLLNLFAQRVVKVNDIIVHVHSVVLNMLDKNFQQTTFGNIFLIFPKN